MNGSTITEYDPVLEDAEHRYFVTAEIFRDARLRLPSVVALKVGNREYYPLSAVPGLIAKFDRRRQLLEIQAPAEAFVRSSLDARDVAASQPQLSEPGVFLNHEIQYSRNTQAGAFAGQVEAGLFSRLGVVTTRLTSSNLAHGASLIRQDTQLTRDLPSRRASLAIGDSVSASNSWANQVYFAGVRYASKFSTQPGFLAYSLPSLSGLAVQPSVVDVYVNNVKTLSNNVDTGPFSISNVPVISGKGDIQMGVTDALGRQQVVSQQYVSTSQLLRKGVSEYTYEAGTPRMNMGTASFGYRSFFAEGTHRYGLTELLTIEGRAELGLDNQTAGGGFVAGIPGFGTVGGGAAAGQGHGRSGALVYADFSCPARVWNFSGHYQASSDGFRQLGLLASERPYSQIIQANMSRSIGSRMNVGAGYLRRDGRTDTSTRGPFASFDVRLGAATLSVSGTYSTMKGRQYGLSMSLVIPLGHRTTAVSSGSYSRDSGHATYEVHRNLGIEPGYGYRFRRNTFDNSALDASVSYQNEQGAYTVETGRSNGQTSVRAYERGSLTFLHGHLLASRWLNDSFAVIDVPGRKNVAVYVNNHLSGRTNRRGSLLVPRMVAYDQNVIRIDDKDVPLDSSADIGERTVIPYPRSGLYMKFTAEPIIGATIRLVTPDGKPVPLGASASLKGESVAYLVAMRGEVFVSKMQYPAVLTVEWEGGQCTAEIPGPAPKEPLPRIGPITCK